MKWEVKHAVTPSQEELAQDKCTAGALMATKELQQRMTNMSVDDTRDTGKMSTLQVIDSMTSTKDLKKDEAGNIQPMILSKEERPHEHVFQNIVNFRDIGSNYNDDCKNQIMRREVFFRSGRLDDATTKDLELLIKTYKIRAVIDLRAETEGKMGSDLTNSFPAGLVGSNIASQIADNAVGAIQSKQKDGRKHRIRSRVRKHKEKKAATRAPTDQTPSDGQTSSSGEEHAPTQLVHTVNGQVRDQSGTESDSSSDEEEFDPLRVTYYVNFAGSNFRYNSVWKPLPYKLKLKMLGYVAKGEKPKAIEMVGKELIEPKGLKGLNEDFIDYCGEEIVAALRIMSKVKNYPLLVHCTQGKDRTGLVVAIALAICGVADAFIVTDYARTQEGLLPQRDIMVEEMRKTGLSPSFSDAPPEVMYHALHYIRRTHGSIRGYVNRYGLTDQEMQSIRDILMEPQFSHATDST
ncbi:hypothetical protein PROFUN_09488 [Planoprotostelium fungivorum]|uniref:Tyrosine specific protein phosphatases domain-containing protein n=2 Tax=Planoprotostelium fungivorum TaxID=1890364 RepID=A0A2P6NH39_9EUKA|nr:hypothetical protein PROFUN_09488 [Planoprotostelium fungivorum]